MPEWMIESCVAMIAGMGTVFAILVIILLVIYGFGLVSQKQRQSYNTLQAVSSEPNDDLKDSVPMDHIVAAISTVLIQELGIERDRLRIRSIRKL